MGGVEYLPEDGERRAWCFSSTPGAAPLSFFRIGVARDEERFLYTRNGVLSTGGLLGPCRRSSRVPSLIAAATASAKVAGDRRERLPDCVFGRGYSLRNGDGNGDTAGGFGDSDGWSPICRLRCKI
jgi:hypothetical protein